MQGKIMMRLYFTLTRLTITSQFFLAVTNTWEENTKKRIYLASEVSVNGWLHSLFWIWSKAEYHGGGRVWYKRLLISWQPGSQERDRKGRWQGVSFQSTPLVVYFLQVGPMSYFPRPLDNITIHQRINPPMKSECHDLIISQWWESKSSTYVPFGGDFVHKP
jgi:hypothetical protein